MLTLILILAVLIGIICMAIILGSLRVGVAGFIVILLYTLCVLIVYEMLTTGV